jgi:DNA-directed RNA polymerase subunit RPC12/RpoP
MYRCPHCGDRSISAWSQFSPPFDSRTSCPSCGAKVKVKFKLTNLLVVAGLLGMTLPGVLFGSQYRIDPFIQMVGLIACAFLQIRLTAYEKRPE